VFSIKWDLSKVVVQDLAQYKLIILALFLILILSFSIITQTHNTRLLTNNKELLLTQRDFSDVEWRNLLLEQSTLEEHSNIEYMAKHKLGMYRPSTAEEKLVKQQ